MTLGRTHSLSETTYIANSKIHNIGTNANDSCKQMGTWPKSVKIFQFLVQQQMQCTFRSMYVFMSSFSSTNKKRKSFLAALGR